MASRDLSPTITGATPEGAASWEWTCRDGEFTALVWRHPEGGGGYILEPDAICDDDRCGVDVSILVSEEHARLIAAAPDLLAALIDARAQLEQYELDLTGETFNDIEINAAIAKASPQASGEGQ